MPNPQVPLSKAKLTGADKKNPQRFRDRSEPGVSTKPVGAPPSYLSRDAKDVWKQAAKDMGWLVLEDRLSLEVLANAIGVMRETVKRGDPVNGAMITAANTAIGKLGASPVDRGKVFQPAAKPDEENDPFAAFGGMQ